MGSKIINNDKEFFGQDFYKKEEGFRLNETFFPFSMFIINATIYV